jgi:hypothetical protein
MGHRDENGLPTTIEVYPDRAPCHSRLDDRPMTSGCGNLPHVVEGNDDVALCAPQSRVLD